MRATRLRGAAWLAALTMIGVACSGAPEASTDGGQVAIDNETGGGEGGADDGGATTGEVGEATTDGDTGEAADTTGEASDTTGGDGAAPGEPTTGGSTSTGGDTSGGDTGGATSGSATSGGTTTTGDATTGQQPPAKGPYSAEDATIGITDDEIYICGHAALIFAEAFDVRAEDLNVYWTMVNENGGVHGRKVRIDWEDDSYNGNQAITAAQTCNARGPFFIQGGIGFDQIPGVRTWAENNGVPYIHHIAVAPDKELTHSFSFLPTVQDLGRAFGQYIASRHGGEKVGIIALESENWSPGHDAAVAEMEARGVEIAHDFEGPRKGAYQSEIFQMQQSGVEVVWIWENALAAGDIIAQANQQQYFPTWVVFPFQTIMDIAEARSPIEGVATWPAYAPGGYATDSNGLNADIEAYEAAVAKYRPGTEANYLLYLTWVGQKALHKVLLDCGPDCDRNRLHAMLTSGYEVSASDQLWRPNCQIDFGRPNSFGNHNGGFTFTAQQVYEHTDGVSRFRTTDWCVTAF